MINVHLEAAVLTSADLTAASHSVDASAESLSLRYKSFPGRLLKVRSWVARCWKEADFEFASLGSIGAAQAQSNAVGVGDTVGRPLLDFATFDLDGSSVPVPTNVSEFGDMRNRMLNLLLKEEERRTTWLGSKQHVDPDKFNSGRSIFTPAFYESFYNIGAKTDWISVKEDAAKHWTRSIPPAHSKNKDPEIVKREFLAERFIEMACDDANAPFVARGLILNEIIRRTGASTDIFLNKVRDIPHCRGAAGENTKTTAPLNLSVLRQASRSSTEPNFVCRQNNFCSKHIKAVRHVDVVAGCTWARLDP